MKNKEQGLLKLAKADLKYAKFAYTQLGQSSEYADLNICAYHAQQCTEKILKHILEYKGHIYERTYDISILVDRCRNLGIDVPEVIEASSVVITSWATQPRYNSEFKASIRVIAKVLDTCEQWITSLEVIGDILLKLVEAEESIKSGEKWFTSEEVKHQIKEE